MFGGVRALSLLPEVLTTFNISIAISNCSKTLQKSYYSLKARNVYCHSHGAVK